MNKKIKIVRNEPLRQFTGDKIPHLPKSNFAQLPELVKARIEIEEKTIFCPVGKHNSTIKWTNYHKKALSIMLMESGSPVSASLRAFAAGVMGPLNILSSVEEINKICFNGNEDLRTRINALHSLLKFAEKDKIKNIEQIFKSKTVQIRFTALKQALNSKNKILNRLGKNIY